MARREEKIWTFNAQLGEAGSIRIGSDVQLSARNNSAYKLAGDIAENFRGNTDDAIRSGVGAFDYLKAGTMRVNSNQTSFELERLFDSDYLIDITKAQPNGRWFSTSKYTSSSEIGTQLLSLDTANNNAQMVVRYKFADDVGFFIGRTENNGIQFYLDGDFDQLKDAGKIIEVWTKEL